MDDNAPTCPSCGAAASQDGAGQQNAQPPAYSPPSYSPPPAPNFYQPYQAPYTQPVPANVNEHVSVGAWIGIFFINVIPIIGPLVYLVLLFVWAFGNTAKKSLKAYAKAQLIIAAVLIALSVLAAIVLAIAGFSFSDFFQEMADEFDNSYYYHIARPFILS